MVTRNIRVQETALRMVGLQMYFESLTRLVHWLICLHVKRKKQRDTEGQVSLADEWHRHMCALDKLWGRVRVVNRPYTWL